MKGKIYKGTLLTLLLAFGVCGYFAMPDAVAASVPAVATVRLAETVYCETVCTDGIIMRDEDSWLLMSPVIERDIPRICVGQTAVLSGAAIGEGKYTAVVTEISSSARQQTGMAGVETVVDVTLTIANPDEQLRTGYTATAEISTADSRVIRIVPYSVICQDEQGEYVYIISDDKTVRRCNVETGAELSNGTEILSGLPLGCDIICEPEKVTENALVQKTEGDIE